VLRFDEDLPALDCHAHIAPDVTPAQVRGLEGAVVLAVTNSLAEGGWAADYGDPALVWGCGVHPGDADALAEFEPDRFAAIARRVALIGEVGLAGRKKDIERQRSVLAEVLRRSAREPVLVSIHSASAVGATLDVLEANPHVGAVLHWFLGDAGQVERATRLGAYFSVPGAMSDERIALFPRERVLPETDFPSGGPRSGRRPGDTAGLEVRLAGIWRTGQTEVRHTLWQNLRRITSASGAADRLPERVQDLLLIA
jgi:TatD DNase family protein